MGELVYYHECLKEKTYTVTIGYFDKNNNSKCYKYEKRLRLPPTTKNGFGTLLIDAMNVFCKRYAELEVEVIVDITVEEKNDDENIPDSAWYIV